MSARKALSRARGALDKNQEAEALQYYEQVLAQEPLPGSRRAEALYGAGLLHAHADPELRDLGKAREYLQELLSVYPTYERKKEAQAALALLLQIDALREESDGLRTQVSHRDDACAEEKTRLIARAQSAEEAASAGQAETQSLKSEVKTLRGEAQSLRGELEKRDEALRKVREALVGKRARK